MEMVVGMLVVVVVRRRLEGIMRGRSGRGLAKRRRRLVEALWERLLVGQRRRKRDGRGSCR